jgi:hypothetical protein
MPVLTWLFEPKDPPKQLIHPTHVAQIYYGFGNASQDGFGFNIQEQKGDTIHYCFGQWCDSKSKK